MIIQDVNFLPVGGQVKDVKMNPDRSAVVTFISPTAAQTVMKTGRELQEGGRRIELSWFRQKETGGGEQQPRVRPAGPVELVSVGPGWGVPQYLGPVQLTSLHSPLVHHYLPAPPHTFLPHYYYPALSVTRTR